MALGGFGTEHLSLIEQASTVLLIGALVLSYVVAVRLDRYGSPLETLRKRFLVGIPWGTLIVILLVYLVYTVVQGAGEPGGPNIVAFRSWSVWYPQSLLLSWFSHASQSHLTGNLLGTVVFATIAEYAWSHYPTERGEQSFSTWRTNPFGRIGVFILVTGAIGILGALLVPGAVIGFSGVVFAYAGFAIVVKPLLSVGGIVGLQVLDLVYRGFTSPLGIAEADTEFVSPSWAETALQGHLFGLVIGVLLAVFFFRYRSVSPKLRYIWFAAAVFAVSRSMWAIFWFISETEFLLFRGLGAASVLVLASVVALSVLPNSRSLSVRSLRVPLRKTAVSILVIIIVLLAVAGIPYNLVDVSPGEEAENGIEIDGYTVTYAENVEDQYISIDLPVVGDLLSVETSGVVVTSDNRNIWALDTPSDELAFEGNAVVVVGDTTWREVVILNHTQWELIGGNTTYKVYGQHWQEMDDQELLFQSPSAEAAPTINGTTFSIRPAEESYEITVEGANETLEYLPVPSHNESTELAGVTFEREEDEITAIHEQTEIPFAQYREERE